MNRRCATESFSASSAVFIDHTNKLRTELIIDEFNEGESRMNRFASAVGVLAAVLALGACGSGSPTESADGSTDAKSLTKITIGTVPVVNSGALYLGVKKGFFRDEGLDVKIQKADSGPALAAGVVSGKMQFAISSVVPALQAQSRGVPLKVVAPADASGPDGNNAVVAKAGSGLKSLADLQGKRIGIQALKSGNELMIRGAAKVQNVDASKFEFVVVPSQDVPTLVQTGQIAAGWLSEPYLSTAKARGDVDVVLNDPNAVVLGKAPLATVWFTSQKLIDRNPDTVHRFVRAITKSNDYATSNIDEVRAIIPTFTGLTAKEAKAISLPSYPTELDMKQMERYAELMTDEQFAPNRPDPKDLVYKKDS